MSERPVRSRSRPLTWKHGRNCYANHGCRCEICTREHRIYHRDYRRARRKAAQATITALSQENQNLKKRVACTPETTKEEGASQPLRADVQE